MAKTVLIVDDSIYMRTKIHDALTNAGYHVIAQAVNGEEAIDLAIKFEPDLITLDNILPDMIGNDILTKLKHEEKISSNIVMISAIAKGGIIEEVISLGAKDYIVKPFTDKILVESINNAMV